MKSAAQENAFTRDDPRTVRRPGAEDPMPVDASARRVYEAHRPRKLPRMIEDFEVEVGITVGSRFPVIENIGVHAAAQYRLWEGIGRRLKYMQQFNCRL